MKQQILLQYFNGRYVEEEFKGKFLVLHSLILPTDLRSKVLSLGNTKKSELFFGIALAYSTY